MMGRRGGLCSACLEALSLHRFWSAAPGFGGSWAPQVVPVVILVIPPPLCFLTPPYQGSLWTSGFTVLSQVRGFLQSSPLACPTYV